MFAFGHAGLTIGAARALDLEIDPRWAAALALGPDLLDKPVELLFPALVTHNTRNFGHTGLFALLVLLALLIWKRRPGPAFALWGCYIGHFLLDGMWLHPSPGVFFWPLLGDFPAPLHGNGISWVTVWYVLGEIAGFVILYKLARRHGLFERPRLIAFLKSGRLV